MRPVTVTIIILLLIIGGFVFVKPMLRAKDRTGQVGEEGLNPSDEGQAEKEVEEYPAKEQEKPEQVEMDMTRAEAQDLALKHVKDAIYNSHLFDLPPDLTSDELKNRKENIEKYTEWVEGYTIAMSETSSDGKYWIVRIHNQKESTEDEIEVEVRSRTDIKVTEPLEFYDTYWRCGDKTCSKQGGETCRKCPSDCGTCSLCETIDFDYSSFSACKVLTFSEENPVRVTINNRGTIDIKPIIRLYDASNLIQEIDFDTVQGSSSKTMELDIGTSTPNSIEVIPQVFTNGKETVCSDISKKTGLAFCNVNNMEQVDMVSGDTKITLLKEYVLNGGIIKIVSNSALGGGSPFNVCNVDDAIPSSVIKLEVSAKNWVKGLSISSTGLNINQDGVVTPSEAYYELPYKKCLRVSNREITAEKGTAVTTEPHPSLVITAKHSGGVYDTKEIIIQVVERI